MLFWLKKFVSFWLMPLPFCLTLLAVGLCVLLWSRRARLGRGLLFAGTILLMLFSNKFVSDALVRPLEIRYGSICLVLTASQNWCLGNYRKLQRAPSPRLCRR
jgi:hypothetical protein